MGLAVALLTEDCFGRLKLDYRGANLRTCHTANRYLTLQEYFSQSVGQVKKVELSYGPGGVSRGIATVIFAHADGASKAFSELNGLLVDNRPVKVKFNEFNLR
jgi:hypothetical protein